MDIDAIHKALANPMRRQILAWLKEPDVFFSEQQHPLSLGVCAGMIDRRAGLSQFPNNAALKARLAAQGDQLKAIMDASYDPNKRVDTSLQDLWTNQ